MEAEQKVGAVQLSARLRGAEPAVIRRLLITEQSSLAELQATLQVSFGWSDQHLYCFQIPGWHFGDPAQVSIGAVRNSGVSQCDSRVLAVDSSEMSRVTPPNETVPNDNRGRTSTALEQAQACHQDG